MHHGSKGINALDSRGLLKFGKKKKKKRKSIFSKANDLPFFLKKKLKIRFVGQKLFSGMTEAFLQYDLSVSCLIPRCRLLQALIIALPGP